MKVSRIPFCTPITAAASLALVVMSLSANAQSQSQDPAGLKPPLRDKANPTVNWAKAREVTKPQTLQQEMNGAKSMATQLTTMVKPLNDKRPGEGNSLYSKSIILSDGDYYTLVPVGSILHLPASLRSRVIEKPQGEFTFWPSFQRRNEAWLAGKEVPLSMAKGDAALAAKVFKETASSTKVLISVYRDCPITVLEPVAEDKPTEAKSR